MYKMFLKEPKYKLRNPLQTWKLTEFIHLEGEKQKEFRFLPPEIFC
jgi:hypothetical protein